MRVRTKKNTFGEPVSAEEHYWSGSSCAGTRRCRPFSSSRRSTRRTPIRRLREATSGFHDTVPPVENRVLITDLKRVKGGSALGGSVARNSIGMCKIGLSKPSTGLFCRPLLYQVQSLRQEIKYVLEEVKEANVTLRSWPFQFFRNSLIEVFPLIPRVIVTIVTYSEHHHTYPG